MTKEITTCDICGQIIEPTEKRYKVVSHWWLSCFGEQSGINDMCRDCYDDYRLFVQRRLADKVDKE